MVKIIKIEIEKGSSHFENFPEKHLFEYPASGYRSELFFSTFDLQTWLGE